MKNISILFLVLFAFACTPDKDDSIYDYPDNTNVKNDEDNPAKTDNPVINDTDSQLPDSEVPDTSLPDNETTDDPLIATCGNEVVDFGEVCERDTQKECSEIDPGSYSGGVAKCNDSCSGWVVSDCVSVGCETAVDNPDDAFTDTNCDGIDGDASASVFVDKLTGNNTNPGTKDLPVATITKALEIAEQSSRKHILVGIGAYSEKVELKEGISIHGAYSGHPEWKRGVENEVQIVSGNPCVIADGVSDVTLAFLVIRAAHNFEETGTSTAVLLKNSSMIYFNNVDIESGHGGDGVDGQNGAAGDPGGNGNPGTPGCENSGGVCDKCDAPKGGEGGSSTCGMTGGKGGDAGHGSSAGLPGSAGAGGTGTAGIGGTSPYVDVCPEPSIKGNDGNSGNIGEQGAAGKSFGGYDENGYIPGHGGDGVDGTHGHGGGGGGGGRGGDSICDSYGSSGGGGGAGGCAGGAGTGGTAGGGSFGIWSYKCTDIILRGVRITTSDGGKGGKGGNGGEGGFQGFGALSGLYGGSDEQGDGGCGGQGGNGGAGGKGGSGGGGGGGPSIGIVSIESTFDGIMHTTFLIGKGGEGGKSELNEGYPGKENMVLEY